MSLNHCPGCPGDWETFRGHCYKYFKELKTWDAAAETCAQQPGGKCALASVTDKEEMDFISRITSGKSVDVWIGGKRDCHTCSTWQWIEGGAISYFNWRSGEPNNIDTNDIKKEDCIEISINWNDLWNDQNCGDIKEFVCKSV